MVPQELPKSDIVKIIEQLDKLLPSNSINKQGRDRRKAYYDKGNLKLDSGNPRSLNGLLCFLL